MHVCHEGRRVLRLWVQQALARAWWCGGGGGRGAWTTPSHTCSMSALSSWGLCSGVQGSVSVSAPFRSARLAALCRTYGVTTSAGSTAAPSTVGGRRPTKPKRKVGPVDRLPHLRWLLCARSLCARSLCACSLCARSRGQRRPLPTSRARIDPHSARQWRCGRCSAALPCPSRAGRARIPLQALWGPTQLWLASCPVPLPRPALNLFHTLDISHRRARAAGSGRAAQRRSSSWRSTCSRWCPLRRSATRWAGFGGTVRCGCGWAGGG